MMTLTNGTDSNFAAVAKSTPNKDHVEISVSDKKESKAQKKLENPDPDGTTLMIYFISETLGTAMLLFFGCMGVCVPKLMDFPTGPQFGAIGFGLTVLTVIQAFGHISGAHLNPQVTLAALILDVIKPICFPVYVTAQFVGACIGFGLLKLLIPPQYADGLCETLPEKHMTDIQALAVEAILTGCLVLVCAAIWDSRNAHNTDSIPIRLGFIIACLSMAGGPFTGASMNTARTFAPILINGHWVPNQWIYWMGPTIGSVTAAFLYKYLLNIPNHLRLCI